MTGASPDGAPTRRPAVAVMCRPPVPGRTKTRLQARLRPHEAARVAEALLLDTVAVLGRVPDIEVVLAVDSAEGEPWFETALPGLHRIVQSGPTLGHRLDGVLCDLLRRGHRVAAAVGADSPLLDPDEVTRAIGLVGPEAETVLGPTDDGGYYLIATATPPGPLVTDITMSTPRVLADTVDLAGRLNRSVALVAGTFDVDEPGDLDRLAAELARRPPTVAPATRRALADLASTGDRRLERDRDRVVAVIPALNEEAAIADVVARCRVTLQRCIGGGADHRVVVVDNGSTDETAARAEAAGALVVREPRRGYGRACAAGVAAAADLGASVVAFVDGDASSPPEELPAVVDPVLAGEADLVQGSRSTGSIAAGAMAAHQRLGNAFAAWLLRRLYRLEVTDLGPFRAIGLDTLTALGMTEMTYGWPTEMTVKAANAGARIREVPVSWLPRAGGRSKVSGTVRGSVLAARYIVGVTLHHSGPGQAATRTLASTRDRVRSVLRRPVPTRLRANRR